MSDGRRALSDDLDAALGALVAGRTDALVVDVGGGSGARAVPLARQGYRVIVVDASADALAILHRRAEDAGVEGLVSGRQADAHQLATVVADGSADLLLCHHLLEEVDDPVATIAAIARAARPGGWVSVVAAGRLGAVLAHAVAGRFADAARLLDDPDGRIPPSDPLRRRYDPDGLADLIAGAGLTATDITGLDAATGLVTGAVRQSAPAAEAGLHRLDAMFGRHPTLRQLAPDVHVLARRDPAAEATPG